MVSEPLQVELAGLGLKPEKLLGQGSFGTVYLVVDESQNKYALKVLYSEFETESPMLKEIEALLSMKRIPNAVEIYSWGSLSDSGRRGILMEYLSGGDLTHSLKWPLHKRLRAVIQVAHGLCDMKAEVRGFCHLDLKPQNCMLTKYGAVKVSDFGLASMNAFREVALDKGASSLSPLLMQQGNRTLCVGTPLYMAPEQFLGTCVNGQSADTYAFALMVIELLRGRHPFYALGRIEDVMVAHFRSEVDMKGLPVDRRVKQCLQECLSKEPQRRPAIEELCGSLVAFAHREYGTNGRVLASKLSPKYNHADSLCLHARFVREQESPEKTLAFLRSACRKYPYLSEVHALRARYAWNRIHETDPSDFDLWKTLDTGAKKLGGAVAMTVTDLGENSSMIYGSPLAADIEEGFLGAYAIDECRSDPTLRAIGGCVFAHRHGVHADSLWSSECLRKHVDHYRHELAPVLSAFESDNRYVTVCDECGEVVVGIFGACPRCGIDAWLLPDAAAKRLLLRDLMHATQKSHPSLGLLEAALLVSRNRGELNHRIDTNPKWGRMYEDYKRSVEKEVSRLHSWFEHCDKTLFNPSWWRKLLRWICRGFHSSQ